MAKEKVSVLMCEGGQVSSSVDQMMVGVRKSVALDNIERLRQLPQIKEVILCTNYPDLAEAAGRLGADIVDTSAEEEFHFGFLLHRVVKERGLRRVLYMGGASAPLITLEELRNIVSRLSAEDGTVMTNNALSADIIAFSPASALEAIELPAVDNALGLALAEQAGLKQVVMEPSAGVLFDVDTPTDIMILCLHPGVGSRTAEQLRRLELDLSRLLAARERLRTPYAEVLVAGRVGPALMAFIHERLKCRLRVFSEERGMKALGRAKRGEVVSLLGCLIDSLGVEGAFARLATMCDVGFLDTRVLFAHEKKNVSDWDRFNSDLGRVELIEDDWVREFTRGALAVGVPMVLGGHSLVLGGLWALVETLDAPVTVAHGKS